ncbi:hypothetical protein GCM10023186_24430 [Hymenobacter koreensis]|uniref:Uncharacterized protein n=1 Tax=Hymenobacter koreensis TaxID=1084523 RepID=A0ABP8J1N2_9BACT
MLAAYNWRYNTRIKKERIRVQGEIVELEMALKLAYCYPIVRFQTRKGQMLTLTYSERVHRLAVEKGQKVEISYLADAPEQFMIISESIFFITSPTPSRPYRFAKGQEPRRIQRNKS